VVILQEEPFRKSLDEIKQMTALQIHDLLKGSQDLEPELRYQRMSPAVSEKARKHGYYTGK